MLSFLLSSCSTSSLLFFPFFTFHFGSCFSSSFSFLLWWFACVFKYMYTFKMMPCCLRLKMWRYFICCSLPLPFLTCFLRSVYKSSVSQPSPRYSRFLLCILMKWEKEEETGNGMGCGKWDTTTIRSIISHVAFTHSLSQLTCSFVDATFPCHDTPVRSVYAICIWETFFPNGSTQMHATIHFYVHSFATCFALLV